MMRRRTAVGLLAGVLLAGLIAVPGAPAGAQDIADLPRLGFEIDPNQGFPGDLVEGWVDTDDVAEHCMSFEELDPVTEASEMFRVMSALLEDYAPAAEAGLRPIPGGMTFEELNTALSPMINLFLGLGLGSTANKVLFWEAFFVLTFVEPATTELVGPMGNFDPTTGEGSIVTPELEPGLYAVAAACLFFLSNEALLAEGGGFDLMAIRMHEWLAVNHPDGLPPLNPNDPAFIEFILDAAEQWMPEVVEPRAIGIDFYCILQPDGFCATPPGPVGLIDDDVLEEFNGDGLGDEPLAPGPGADGLDDAGDLVAVQATPSFTG